MHVLWQGTVFYISVLAISPVWVCTARARGLGLWQRRFPPLFHMCKAWHQARGVWEHQCCESANSGLPVSLFKGKSGRKHTMSHRELWLVGGYSEMSRLVVDLIQTLTFFHVLTITKSTSLCFCSGFFWGVFYHQFSLLILTRTEMCGSDAWSYSPWILSSLEEGWDWGNADFQMPSPTPRWDRAWGHTQGQPRAMCSHTTDSQHQAAQLLVGKQKVLLVMPEWKRHFTRISELALLQVCMAFSTDQMISKFFHSIKRNTGLSAILSLFLLHTSLFSKKYKGIVSLKGKGWYSLNFYYTSICFKKPSERFKTFIAKNPLSPTILFKTFPRKGTFQTSSNLQQA